MSMSTPEVAIPIPVQPLQPSQPAPQAAPNQARDYCSGHSKPESLHRHPLWSLFQQCVCHRSWRRTVLLSPCRQHLRIYGAVSLWNCDMDLRVGAPSSMDLSGRGGVEDHAKSPVHQCIYLPVSAFWH